VTTGAEVAGARNTNLNPTRTKPRPTPATELADAAHDPSPCQEPSPDPLRHFSRLPTDREPDPLKIVDLLREPNASFTPTPHLATNHPDDTDEDQPPPTTMRERWARIWPSLLALITLPAVGGPAAVASYRHARDVITEHGDPVMAPWLALTTDGMLLAALIVIWVRRHRGEHVRAGPWAAFWAGMAATIAANLAAAQPTPAGIVVALWPPVCLAITLELVALVASPAKQHSTVTDALPAESTADAPIDTQPAPGQVPADTALEHRAPTTDDAGHDTSTDNRHPVHETPAEPTAQTTRAQAAAQAGTNGHAPVPVPAVPTVPAPDLPARADARARERHGPGMKPDLKAGQNGHRGRAWTGRAPDSDILAWLRQQARTNGQVPGRRKVIEKWATGSTRADRLRRIVLDEATSKPPFDG
jgi:hypothetical protein